MYRVIIADDELRICALLEKSIRWEELGLLLIATCTNGPALLKTCQEQKPDIVITDIQMPGMNGIDAIRQIRENGDGCQIIIISGYQEFSYAHNALKYDVSDYLLKPINADELNASLRKIIMELDSAASVSSGTSEDASFREHFLSTFLPILMQQGTPVLQDINAAYHTQFRDGSFCGLYLYIDTGMNGHEVGELNPILGKIRDICSSILEPMCHEVLFSVSGDGLQAGINYSVQQQEIDRAIQAVLDRSLSVIELFTETEITIGVGETVSAFSRLYDSLNQATDVVRFRSAVGRNRILYHTSLYQDYDFARINKGLSGQMSLIRRAYETCRDTAFSEAYEHFLSSSEGSDPLVQYLFLEQVCDLFGRFIDETFPQSEKAAMIKTEIKFEMQHTVSLDALLRKVQEIIMAALREFDRLLKDRENLPIRQAKDYIYQNYQKQLRLEDIAAAVYLSPAYLSNAFKKATGTNLVNFINEYRIEQAKNLLISSNMTVDEIANAVGFDSHRYFGNVFKKMVGINPTEYRKLYH